MALIKCSNCGQNMSDKAKACPHCGMQVNEIGQPSRGGAEPLPGLSPSHRKSGSDSKAAIMIVVAIVALALLGAGGWLLYDKAQQRAQQLAWQAEQARQDSIAQAQLLEQMRQDSIAQAKRMERIEVAYNGYAGVLKRFLLIDYNDSGYNGYFLFDFNQDGMPELCVEGMHPDDYDNEYTGSMFYVYTIQGNKAQRIFKKMCDSPNYYLGSDYILSADESYEYYTVEKIRYSNGIIVSSTITEIHDPYGDKPRPAISEGKVSEFRMSDLESLKSQIMSNIQIN